jgi:lipopolysaccharide biosynthesis glycosyltransferase
VELITRPKAVPDAFHHPTYMRFWAYQRFARDYDRVLYVDADIYPESDRLFALFDLEFGPHVVAGVRDLQIAFSNNDEERASARADDPRKYLNAGITLLDGKRFMESGILADTFALSRIVKKPPLHDQTLLNMVLRGNWLELSPAFNMLRISWESFVRRVFEPVIVHFAGPKKPWMGNRFTMNHPARREMEAYFPKTPWAAFLSNKVDFQAAWNLANAGGPPKVEPPPFTFDRDFPNRHDFLRFIAETDFADVVQGITVRHAEHIPPR